MSNKPTYEELEQRVKELEQEAVKRKQAEEELKKHHDNLEKIVVERTKNLQKANENLCFNEDIIRSSSSTIATCDLEGKMTFGNPSFIKTWGFDDAKEFLGRHFSEFWVVKERLDEILQALQSKGKWFGELKAKRKDGTLFYAQVSAATVYDVLGNPVALTSTSIDISDRKRAEEQLRESEEKYRLLVENIPSVTWATSEHGKTTFISPNVEKIFGYTQEEIYEEGESVWLGRIHPDDAEQVKKSFGAMFSEQKKFDVGYRIQRKDGEWIWLHDIAMRAFEKDNIWYAYGVFSDMTERKRTEEALRESEDRYRSLFNNSHSVMLVIDPDSGNIVDANPAAISYYGWSYAVLTAKKISDINLLSQEQVSQEMEKATTEECSHFNFQHQLSSGDIRDVEAYSGPIKIYGENLLYSIIHDVTDRKHAEKEREKLIKKLGKALKEIKTLRGILPLCSFCKKIRDDKGYWEQVDVYIHRHSEADISHSICPECMKKHYPEEYESLYPEEEL